MTFPFGEDIVLVANGPATTDDYGDPVPTQTEVVVRGAFSAGVSIEDSGDMGRSRQGRSQPEVYLPPGSDVSWIDAVRIGGVTYQVDGQPQEWANPFTGWRAGVVVRLQSILAEPR